MVLNPPVKKYCMNDNGIFFHRKLISGQMSMSEEERDRIMKEHEKQMVKVENR